MTTWIIEPHDPLIFRDGRPFGPNPGARAKTLSFPFPSTTTGGVRTRAGLDKDKGTFITTRENKSQYCSFFVAIYKKSFSFFSYLGDTATFELVFKLILRS